MMMRVLLMSVVAVVGVLAVVDTASAQPPNLSPMDCSVLSGTPYICVRNPSRVAITGIACTGFWGTSPMSVPGAVIPTGATAIVKFAGKCEKTIRITRRDGTTFEIQGFDVDKNTVLNVPDN